MLAWACTIYKVQGLTLPNLVILIQLDKQRTFVARELSKVSLT